MIISPCPPHACENALRTLQAGFDFARCTVACSFSDWAHKDYNALPAARAGAPPIGAYEACRAEVSRWLSDHRRRQQLQQEPTAPGVAGAAGVAQVRADALDVRVAYLELPVQLCPLGSGAFLLPIDGGEPLLDSDLPEIRRASESQGDSAPPLQELGDVPWSALPGRWQRAYGGCAVMLAGLLRAAALKPTLFTMGPSSLLVARQVEKHLSASGSAAAAAAAGSASPTGATAAAAISSASSVQGEASVLIVDRSLDAVAPAMRTDHPLDALLTTGSTAAPRAPPPPTSPSARHPPSPPATPPPAAPPTPSMSRQPPPPPPPPSLPGPPLCPSVQQALAGAEPTCAALLDALLTRRGKEVGQQV